MTLVDENGHHIGSQNNWGNCGPDCPISPNKQNETNTVLGRTCTVDVYSLVTAGL